MVVYELDLSKLSIQQMKDIIRIVNPSCGENDAFSMDCDLCLACWKENLERYYRNEESGIDISPCG
jgi:hypothetical protein